VLKAFVLAEKSVYGVAEEIATQETHKKMKALFESCGVATSNRDRYAWRDDALVPLDLYDVEDDGKDEKSFFHKCYQIITLSSVLTIILCQFRREMVESQRVHNGGSISGCK
jgi:hypothetical protein